MSAAIAYPRCTELGLQVVRHSTGFSYVPGKALRAGLMARGQDFSLRFSELFGCQTMAAEGPFASDVEDVLERMMSGRRTGGQLIWD